MDASKEGLGGVLLQNDYATIIRTLKMWRNYLMGRKFLLKTNNMSLKYLFHQPDLNARQARCLDFLNKYHFELKHIKGKENKVSNALRWWTHMIYEVTLSQTDADLHENIRVANRVDPFYVDILNKFHQDRLIQQQQEYNVDESWLLWSKYHLYVPEGWNLWSRILIEFHWELYSGHLEYQKILFAIKRHFF